MTDPTKPERVRSRQPELQKVIEAGKSPPFEAARVANSIAHFVRRRWSCNRLQGQHGETPTSYVVFSLSFLRT